MVTLSPEQTKLIDNFKYLCENLNNPTNIGKNFAYLLNRTKILINKMKIEILSNIFTKLKNASIEEKNTQKERNALKIAWRMFSSSSYKKQLELTDVSKNFNKINFSNLKELEKLLLYKQKSLGYTDALINQAIVISDEYFGDSTKFLKNIIDIFNDEALGQLMVLCISFCIYVQTGADLNPKLSKKFCSALSIKWYIEVLDESVFKSIKSGKCTMIKFVKEFNELIKDFLKAIKKEETKDYKFFYYNLLDICKKIRSYEEAGKYFLEILNEVMPKKERESIFRHILKEIEKRKLEDRYIYHALDCAWRESDYVSFYGYAKKTPSYKGITKININYLNRLISKINNELAKNIFVSIRDDLNGWNKNFEQTGSVFESTNLFDIMRMLTIVRNVCSPDYIDDNDEKNKDTEKYIKKFFKELKLDPQADAQNLANNIKKITILDSVSIKKVTDSFNKLIKNLLETYSF